MKLKSNDEAKAPEAPVEEVKKEEVPKAVWKANRKQLRTFWKRMSSRGDRLAVRQDIKANWKARKLTAW
jgi:hypothetical protein